ncbi:MAG: hypothetical protein RL499_1309 [Actinomycetota bacterium]
MTTDSTAAPTPSFDTTIVAAVLHHMNDDHTADNLLIARAFGDTTATSARMTHVDGLAGHWVYSVGDSAEHPLSVAWSQPISERAEIRREIVALYDRACATLGVEPRPHE